MRQCRLLCRYHKFVLRLVARFARCCLSYWCCTQDCRVSFSSRVTRCSGGISAVSPTLTWPPLKLSTTPWLIWRRPVERMASQAVTTAVLMTFSFSFAIFTVKLTSSTSVAKHVDVISLSFFSHYTTVSNGG